MQLYRQGKELCSFTDRERSSAVKPTGEVKDLELFKKVLIQLLYLLFIVSWFEVESFLPVHSHSSFKKG